MSVISPVIPYTGGAEQQPSGTRTLGKDDFLQLMITKLKYQDPLNPMDDADFIAQLAQFSTLEQMNNIAEGIAASNQWDYLQMQSINNTMASGLIGKEVKATYNGIFVDADNSPRISFTTDRYAVEIKFVIKDESGNTVATLSEEAVKPGTGSVTWDARDLLGNRVSEGYFTVEAVATDSAGGTFSPSLSLVGTVDTIVYRGGAAFLRINGTEVPLGDVTAIGAPGTLTDDSDEG